MNHAMRAYDQILTPDDIDFAQYLQESDPIIKVLPAQAWMKELVDSINQPEYLIGAKLPWGKTHDKLRFRPGEISIWAGSNGSGKSQLLGNAILGFAAQNERCCIASFEMKPLSTLKRLLRQAGMNDRPSEAFASRLSDWFKGRLWLYDQMGQVKPEMLYAVIRYCHQELGIQHFVIDSLMKCVRGEDDYNGQKNFLDMLTTLARDCNMHIHLVHHIRKGPSEEKPPGKFDIRGSGSITDQVDQVLMVWRNKYKETQVEQLLNSGMTIDEETLAKPDVLLICEKNRHGEWEGRIPLWYHAPSLQYVGDKRRCPINLVGDLA